MTKKLPTKRDVSLIVSEDVRPELLGKLSLVGWMPGEHFFVGGDSPPGLPSNVAFALTSLTFVFVIRSGEGKFKGHFKIVAPDKKTVIVDAPSDKPIEKPAGSAAIFVTSSKPFIGPTFGTYTVLLLLDNSKFSFPLKIERAPAQQQTRRT